MAQNRTVTDILQELKKDYKRVLIKAVEQATDTACEDVYKFSMSVLERYYDNYMPSSYDRTDNLWRTAIPIAKVEDKGDMIVGTFGVAYDPSVLDGVYVSGATKYGAEYDDGVMTKPGHPEGRWVLENFLWGIHPMTNGSRDKNTVVYDPYQDPISPHKYLEKYLDIRSAKLESDVNDYLLKYITR